MVIRVVSSQIHKAEGCVFRLKRLMSTNMMSGKPAPAHIATNCQSRRSKRDVQPSREDLSAQEQGGLASYFHWKWKVKVLVAQSCLTLSDPIDCSLPQSAVHGISQARILEWVALSFSKGSPWPGDPACVSCIALRFCTTWATRETLYFHEPMVKYNDTFIRTMEGKGFQTKDFSNQKISIRKWTFSQSSWGRPLQTCKGLEFISCMSLEVAWRHSSGK